MTRYKFGEVVLIRFPQSATNARKQRPGIVVLDIGDADVVVAPVTSQLRSQAGDLSVSQLQNTGLILPSWIRLAKIATLLKSDIARTLGRLDDADRSQVAARWQSLFGQFVS